MRASSSIIPFALASLGFAGTSNAWLLEFFSAKTCGGAGHADTERGGLPLQTNKCMMVMEGMNTMRISDFDDNCTVSLWPLDGYCGVGEPLWEKSTSDFENMPDSVMDDGSLCITHISSPGYAAYTCDEEE